MSGVSNTSGPSFVHLHVHSEYSLVDSTVRIPALLEACASAAMPAVALTDRNNLFGMVKFYSKALAAGVKPLIGADIDLRNPDDPANPYTLILLCQDLDGYRNLSRLLSRAFLEGQQRGMPTVDRDWLTPAAVTGLLALSGGLRGDVGQALVNGHERAAAERLAAWRELFGDRYYLELIRTGRPGEEACVQASIALAAAHAVPVVASNDVRFVEADGFYAHEARVCIREGRSLADADRPRVYSERQYLRSPQEMVELFADVPAALANTVEVAKRCNLDLTLGRSVLPAFPVPEGQDEAVFLEAEARRGLERLLAEKFEREDIPADERAGHAVPYRERLDAELDVIKEMGFPGYFLVVADFIDWARNNQVPVGPGRGSGAG